MFGLWFANIIIKRNFLSIWPLDSDAFFIFPLMLIHLISHYRDLGSFEDQFEKVLSEWHEIDIQHWSSNSFGLIWMSERREKNHSNFCQFHCCHLINICPEIKSEKQITDKAYSQTGNDRSNWHIYSIYNIELRAEYGYWENPLLNINRIK